MRHGGCVGLGLGHRTGSDVVVGCFILFSACFSLDSENGCRMVREKRQRLCSSCQEKRRDVAEAPFRWDTGVVGGFFAEQDCKKIFLCEEGQANPSTTGGETRRSLQVQGPSPQPHVVEVREKMMILLHFSTQWTQGDLSQCLVAGSRIFEIVWVTSESLVLAPLQSLCHDVFLRIDVFTVLAIVSMGM